jgi:hypothetical protein
MRDYRVSHFSSILPIVLCPKDLHDFSVAFVYLLLFLPSLSDSFSFLRDH